MTHTSNSFRPYHVEINIKIWPEIVLRTYLALHKNDKETNLSAPYFFFICTHVGVLQTVKMSVPVCRCQIGLLSVVWSQPSELEILLASSARSYSFLFGFLASVQTSYPGLYTSFSDVVSVKLNLQINLLWRLAIVYMQTHILAGFETIRCALNLLSRR